MGIQVEQLIDIGGCEPVGYIAKGRIDPKEFLEIIWNEFCEEPDDLDSTKVQRVLARKVPINGGDCSWRFDIVKERGRGVAEYTYYELGS